MRPLLCSLIAGIFVCTGCEQTAQKTTPEMPNIVYILADDMGYGDVSAYNPDSKIKTTHIDQLASQGVSFTDAHTGSAVCTPTRYGILTGRYSWRTSLKEGVLWGYSPALIESGRETVGSLLQKKGYYTGCIGKWHLGWNWNNLEAGKDSVDFTKPIQDPPTDFGFDYFYGFIGSLDMDPYVYVENDQPTAVPDHITVNKDFQGFWREGPTGPDFDHWDVLPNLTRRAVSFIEEQSQTDDPFFLYLPLPAPHTPILPTDEWLGKSGLNPYGDFVLMVDHTVGQVYQALEKAGIRENTLVIFTCDNGTSPRAKFDELIEKGHYPVKNLRGHKADIYEGGHRVPFIASWPAKTPTARKSDEIICTTDLMATAAALTESILTDEMGEDSYNWLPILLNEHINSPLREATVHHSVNGKFAIRQGEWKLIFTPGSGGWTYPRPGRDKLALDTLPPIQLYNLENDISETANVYDQHPEIVASMTDLMTKYIEEGRSTPGEPQQNHEGQNWWKQITWIEE